MAKRGADPRTNELVKEAVASILETEVADPRLTLVTVTDVRVSHDLSHATVYYTTIDPGLVSGDPRRTGGDELADAEAVAAGLASAGSRIRSLLGRRVRLRQTPELHFEADPVAASASRVEQLLRDVHPTGDRDDVEAVDDPDGAAGEADA